MGFPCGSAGKESTCNAGDLGSTPGSGRSPEKEMATHSSILAWKIPWIDEPSGLQSIGSQRVRCDWATMCLTLCDPMDYTVLGILQTRKLQWVAFPFSRGSFQPRDQTQISRIAGGFFTSWTERPKNIGVGSLSLLQEIFPTQESNWGLPHCSWILYQLSHKGSPRRL